MKKLVIALIVIAAIAAGGHYLLWQQQLEAFEHEVDARVASLNNKHGSDKVSFTYDAKTTGGYPMAAVVSYTNPKLTLAPEIFEQRDATLPESTLSVDTVSLNGTLTIRNAFMQNTSSLEAQGSKSISGSHYGEPYAMTATWDGLSTCSVTYNDGALAFLTKEYKIDTVEDVRDALEAIEAVHCHTNSLAVTDDISKKTIAQIGHYGLDLTSSASTVEEHRLIGFSFDLGDALFNGEPKQYVNDLREMLTPLSEEDASLIALLEQYPALPIMDPAQGGKANIVLSGEYEGPIDDKGAKALRVDIREFTVENEFSLTQFPLSVRIGEDKSVSVRHDGLMRITKKYDDLMQESLDILLKIARDDALVMSEETRALIQSVDMEAIRGLLPDFHEAGDIRLSANLDVAANKAVVIDKAGLETDLFGLVVSGTGNPTAMAADMQLVCHHCDMFITRVAQQANRVGSIMHSLGQNPAPVIVTDAGRQALISFISGLDTDQDQDTVTMTLKNGDGGQMMLSGQPVGMVLIKALGELAPHFQHVSPQLNPQALP